MSDPPALRIHDVVVRAVIGGDAPVTPHAPRDLPDLARFLFDALGAQGAREVKLLDHVTFDVPAASAFAVVGEDGCGKTTLARVCARLVAPDTGKVELDGTDAHRRARALEVRRGLQVILDDPESGFDPLRTVEETLREAASALRVDVDAIGPALERARLDKSVLAERAGALDDGRRRLAALARAFLAAPRVVVIDEPAGHLDPSARGLVLEALAALPASGCAVLVLTKDLAAARSLSTRAAVLLSGAVVEVGETAKVLAAPSHPYAQALVAAAPRVAY